MPLAPARRFGGLDMLPRDSRASFRRRAVRSSGGCGSLQLLVVHCLGHALGSRVSLLWATMELRALGTTVAAVSTGIGLLMLVGLGSLTWSQSKIWHDSVTLWRHALSVTPSAIAHNNLGNALESVGQIDEAIKHLQRAVEIYPTFTQAHHNLGRLLVLRGDLDQAGIHLRLAAKELDPQAKGVSRDLAVLLARQGKVGEATPEFRRALEHDPRDAIALNNLGIILVRRGKLDEAALGLSARTGDKPARCNEPYKPGPRSFGERATPRARFIICGAR